MIIFFLSFPYIYMIYVLILFTVQFLINKRIIELTVRGTGTSKFGFFIFSESFPILSLIIAVLDRGTVFYWILTSFVAIHCIVLIYFYICIVIINDDDPGFFKKGQKENFKNKKE